MFVRRRGVHGIEKRLREIEVRTAVVAQLEVFDHTLAIALRESAVEVRPEAPNDRLDLGPAIMKAIAALDPVFREVVELSDVEGHSYEEIAVALDIPIGTVRSRLYRGRRHLQEDLMVYALDAGYARPSDAANAGAAND